MTIFSDGVFIQPKCLADGTLIWQVIGYSEDGTCYIDGEDVGALPLEGKTLNELTNELFDDNDYIIWRNGNDGSDIR